jgi:carboxymethylenebutenolidase
MLRGACEIAAATNLGDDASMAVVETGVWDLEGPKGILRNYVARPRGVTGRLPVVIAYSDIFQLTPPHERMVRRLAGYGFLVVSPDLYSKIEPPGTALDFDRDRQRALDDAARVELEWVDEERDTLVRALLARPDADGDRLFVCGFCFGGHLAVRTAACPEVKRAVSFYGTGLHDGKLGTANGSADTLRHARDIRGDLLMVWGRKDPHVPPEGRRRIVEELSAAGVRFEFRIYDGEHAFMRDEGPRHDPEATDRAFAEMVAWFRQPA